MKRIHLLLIGGLLILISIPIIILGIVFSICGGAPIYQEKTILNITRNKEDAYFSLLNHFRENENPRYYYLKNSNESSIKFEKINTGNKTIMAWVFLSYAIDEEGKVYEHIAKCL